LPKQLTLHIVWVTPNHGAGEIVEETPDRTVLYSGSSMVVKKEQAVDAALD